MSQQQQEVQELELLLQSSSLIELLELLAICQSKKNVTGMVLDFIKFHILQRMAEDFASTANDQRNKWVFQDFVLRAKTQVTYLKKIITPSTSSPSN